jgi:mannose-6-phosphate isomerase-like protein (cupin superfamily)
MDDQLPLELKKGDCIFIAEGEIHRVLKRNNRFKNKNKWIILI